MGDFGMPFGRRHTKHMHCLWLSLLNSAIDCASLVRIENEKTNWTKTDNYTYLLNSCFKKMVRLSHLYHLLYNGQHYTGIRSLNGRTRFANKVDMWRGMDTNINTVRGISGEINTNTSFYSFVLLCLDNNALEMIDKIKTKLTFSSMRSSRWSMAPQDAKPMATTLPWPLVVPSRE